MFCFIFIYEVETQFNKTLYNEIIIFNNNITFKFYKKSIHSKKLLIDKFFQQISSLFYRGLTGYIQILMYSSK